MELLYIVGGILLFLLAIDWMAARSERKRRGF
jgi:small neutral amino acid transporter SnatA (MarC family)